jgi:hypothetical protein
LPVIFVGVDALANKLSANISFLSSLSKFDLALLQTTKSLE